MEQLSGPHSLVVYGAGHSNGPVIPVCVCVCVCSYVPENPAWLFITTGGGGVMMFLFVCVCKKNNLKASTWETLCW